MKTVIMIAAVVISMNLQAQVATQPSPALKDSVLSIDANKQRIQDSICKCKKEACTKAKKHGKELYLCNNRRKSPDRFVGHWKVLEFGFNAFDKPDYSNYNSEDFMKLNQGKSMEWNVNPWQINIGLYKSYIGFVSGLGFSFNDYRFELPYTLVQGDQRTEPVLLDSKNLSKTKLSVSYVQVPLLLEFQVPVNHHDRVFISAGVLGGVKLGSHTKVQYEKTKDKDHSGFNINSFKYAATARIGYKQFGLFGTYTLTPLFEPDKGPKLTPFTIGILLIRNKRQCP